MNAVQNEQPIIVARTAPTPLLRTVAVCSLVDSAMLIEQMGDREAATFMSRLDRQCRNLLTQHGGREIDKTDGFVFLFERPIQAVAFALDYQRLVWEFGQSEFLPLSARVGIHVGDVVLWEGTAEEIARGAKPLQLEGQIKPVAGCLMDLALPGQILLTGVAHALAMRAQGELSTQPHAQWRKHGRYLIKTLTEPTVVYEVGHADIAPLRRPAWSGKAWREVPWWRRPGMLAVEAAIAVAAIAIPIYLTLRSPPAIAFAQRDWVVVGDLNNLTGKPILDESLENAFRLGLEQSQYVNVLSELKTRDTVALMQRDPAKTRVDRAVGSEVAIRDGARALILPTVAEVGGFVRVSAEIIDPKTQTTVYTESIDGRDIQSVLPSIDTIDKNLRLRLGEALASVSKQSRPLDQVATSNLDALRAFSLGQHAYVSDNMKDALVYYEDAVKLDPNFATARMVIARALLNADHNSAALKQIIAASETPDRLSVRDGMLVDAWMHTLTSTGSQLQKWKLLTNMYPDFYPASGPYAYFAWCDNRYADAITAAKLNIVPQNPNPTAGEYVLGILYLADERYADSMKMLQLAIHAGYGRTGYAALAYAAQHKFNRAEQLLAQNKSTGIASADLSTDVIRIALAVDQGRWTLANSQLDAAIKKASELGTLQLQRLQGIALGLRDEMEGLDKKALEKYAADVASVKTDNVIDTVQARFHLLFIAYLLAHAGEDKQASKLLSSLATQEEDSMTPVKNLALIVTAEVARVRGDPQHAIDILNPLVDGNELFLTHRALLDAYASRDLKAQALSEATWLAHHRGRAYAEYGANQFMTAFNILLSDMALLRAAELEHELDQSIASTKSLEAFEKAWPNMNMPAIVARRQALRQPP